jgi:hypothetical protein
MLSSILLTEIAGYAYSTFLSSLSLKDPCTIEFAMLSMVFYSVLPATTSFDATIGWEGALVMNDEGTASLLTLAVLPPPNRDFAVELDSTGDEASSSDCWSSSPNDLKKVPVSVDLNILVNGCLFFSSWSLALSRAIWITLSCIR